MNKKRFLRIFFPERCKNCGEIIPIEKEECDCLKKRAIRISDEFCEHCGQSQENCVCHFENSVKLSHITAVFIYTGGVKEMISQLKFSRDKNSVPFLSYEMARRFRASFPSVNADTVTCVPCGKKTLEERGYNQSRLLALRVAKLLKTDYEDLLIKTKETHFQHNLSADERAINLKDAFAVADENLIKGKTIILCDDIKTTGNTLYNCSNELYKAGAKGVYCLCAALSDFMKLPF